MDNLNKDMGETKETKEIEPNVFEASKVGCMDENDRVGPNVLKIGIAGSGVTHKEGGNESLYPLRDRENMSDAAPFIFRWAREFSLGRGIISSASNHPECAAVGAQGLDKKKWSEETKILSEKYRTEYVGELPFSTEPAKVLYGNYLSWFDRDKGVPHSADIGIVTIGGAASGKEIENIENVNGLPVFCISADWIKYSLDKGFDRNKAVSVLVFQLKLAYAIAENLRNNNDPFKIFDAHRLDHSSTLLNIEVANEAISIASEKIRKGIWKAASHH